MLLFHITLKLKVLNIYVPSIYDLFYQTILLSSSNKLTQFCDKSQLTRVFGGTHRYNHEDWIRMRKVYVHLIFVFENKIIGGSM